MSTPNNPSGSSAPTYSTNVNRSKTKKWVEAKPVDYGGDDWGAEEDYDDDEYEPPPPPKPTGLRQKGQAMQPVAFPAEISKKSYGNLPALPGQNLPRSASALPRKNSFDQGDEKRAFSSSGTPTGPPLSAPLLQISTQQQSATGFRKASQQELPPVNVSARKSVPQAQDGRSESQSEYTTPQTAASASTLSYSDDIQNRRDYSPSAVPAPLSAISIPQSSADPSTSTTHFPPRKSSLTLQTRPDFSHRQPPDSAPSPWSERARSVSPGVATRTSNPTQDSSMSKPWNEARTGSPGMPSARSPTSPSTQKPLPFVRPADIYKRLAEEKERERQSLDSSRPSMESLVSGTAPDRSPSTANPPPWGSVNSEGYGTSQGDVDGDVHLLHSSRGLMPILEPVQERKSEYGFDGFNPNDLPSSSHARGPSNSTEASANKDSPTAEKRFSRSPELPDFTRMSGFGDDFFSSTPAHRTDSSDPNREEALPTSGTTDETSLRKEPSLGFRTAVNTAFENANSVPPTPSSRLGDSIGRSDSESTGTTGISPIMSRAPSGVTTAEARSREAELREASTPAIAEVLEPESRPQSKLIEPEPKRQSNDVPAVTGMPTEGLVSAEEDDTLTPPARPQAEREISFRPNLPGGWNSYATSASERTVQLDSTETQNSISELSPVRQTTEEDNSDLTPTTSEHTLPPIPVTERTLAEPTENQQSIPATDDSDNDGDLPPPKPLKTKTNTSMSTGSGFSDEETDRLRKEIVKSLSPRNSILPDTQEGGQDIGSNVRESNYLPSEYDNYWNEQEGEPHIEQAPATAFSHEPQEVPDDMAPIPPLAARKIEKSSETGSLAKRFSWEAGKEVVSNPLSASENYVPSQVQVQPPTPNAPSAATSVGSLRDTKPTLPTSSNPELNSRPESSVDENATSGSEAYIGEAALATTGLATAATYASRDAEPGEEHEPKSRVSIHANPVPSPSSSSIHPLEHHPTNTPARSDPSLVRVSSAERDENLPEVSSHPPEVSHTARLSLSHGTGTGIGLYTIHTSLQDILKIPNPHDRIRVYEVVRSKIAAVESGLSDWAMAVKSEHPEYADIDGNYGGSVPYVAPSSRSKFSKALAPASNTLQQPYYQQYLNASSPTSPMPTSPRPPGNSGGYAPSSSQQGGLSGFSSGGAKITTQQVQAKSKEFLHTAGVFGGKGMKAGKGLLAKGKSRFSNRGASGSGSTDKISDTIATVNNDQRSRATHDNQRQRTSFGHKRLHTVGTISRASEASDAVVEEDVMATPPSLNKNQRRLTFGLGGSTGQSTKLGGLGAAAYGRISRFGKQGVVEGEKLKSSNEIGEVGFANDLRGVHQMHFKKSEETAPVLPAIKVNSSLESPTRAMSVDSSTWAAREEYHRHKRSESGLSHHSRSGSAMSGSRRDMSFFLADDDVSEESRDGSVSFGESDENVSYGVAKPAPIGKFQPTWDPYTASPILEGEEDSPLNKQGPNIVKLVPQNTVLPLLPDVEDSKTAPPTMPVASSSTPDESPITGRPQLDAEPDPDGWVMVSDAQPDNKLLTPPISAPETFPPSVPPPTREIPSPPVSNASFGLGPRPSSKSVDHHEATTPSDMMLPDCDPTPSEISRLSSNYEESPVVPMPTHRFVDEGIMTQEEVESPVIPNIFRTIKGDPPTQYARASNSSKPEGQESPKFSLPPIRRGSTFGTLMNGWPGVLGRSNSRTSKASSRRFPIDDGSDGEPEEVPPMPPTPGFARPGTSESYKRAIEKMKAVSVAESDEISQPEDYATIGALVAAGLVKAAFGDEKPSPITQRQSAQAAFPAVETRSSSSNLEKKSQVNSEKSELISDPLNSSNSQGTVTPNQAIGSPASQDTVMPPVVIQKEASEVPDRPSTPIEDPAKLTALSTTPGPRPESPEQSTPATLVDESRPPPDRLSKSSEQWVESAPMADSFVQPSHPPPSYPLPIQPGSKLENSTALSQKAPEARREQRRSQRPDVRIDTTPSSSPYNSTRAKLCSSPIQHRSLPSYESPRIYIPPSMARQTYSGIGPIQAQSSPSAQKDQQLSPGDLPAHLYQAPITKDAAFLPRQQTSEYEIPGIGPPPDEPPPSATRSSRRSSAAFFKEIGGRLSRSGSLAPEDSTVPSSPVTRNNGTFNASVSNITSEDIREKMRNQSRRSSMFGFGPGNLSRSSTNNASSSAGPASPGGEIGDFNLLKPRKRESMITHRPGSKRDTMPAMSEGVRSPVSPLAPITGGDGQERKGPRALFGNASSRPVPNFIPTATVPIESVVTTPKAKGARMGRFSGLHIGGLLGRAGKNKEPASEEGPPVANNSMNSIQQTPIEYRPRNKSLGQLPMLARPFGGRGNKNPKTDENSARADSEERARQRAASAHAILTGPLPPAYTPPLNGFPGQDIEELEHEELEREEPERDFEKEDLSTQIHPAHRPPKQTPIFIEEIPDRGRRKNKEPQYDTPPIPGAYDRVRGDGNSTSPASYDTRGYSAKPGFAGQMLPQNDPASYSRDHAGTESSQSLQQPQKQKMHPVRAVYGSPSNPHPYTNTTPRDDFRDLPSPPHQPEGAEDSSWADSTSGALDGATGLKKGLGFGEDGRVTWQRSTRRRNVSHEDLLARSPARPIVGQQRPYQLSLPEEEENSMHGKKDYSNSGSARSGSTSKDNRKGLGLGLGVGNSSQQGGKTSPSSKAHHLGLHPDLKRPERPRSHHSYEDELVSPGQLLSPRSGRDVDLARSNSEVSQMSNMPSPPLRSALSTQTTNTDITNNKQVNGHARKRSPVPIQIEGIDMDNTDIYNASPTRPTHASRNKNGEAEAEEKIVDEWNQGRSEIVELAAGNDEDEDKVVMCATSYPGMEWNPYAYGEMEYD